MEFLKQNILTLLIFLPIAGSLAVLCGRSPRASRWTALGTTLAVFIVSIISLLLFDFTKGSGYAYESDGGMIQLVKAVKWIPALNIEYRVGVDGLSLPLVIFTTFISFLVCISAGNTPQPDKVRMALLLLLESTVLGVFLSLDLFMFHVFFGLSLLPMYLLIGINRSDGRDVAALKFILYSLCGLVVLLIVMIGTYLDSRDIVPGGTFDLVKLASPSLQASLDATLSAKPRFATLFFVLLMCGFCVRLAGIPFHSWLTSAHEAAPTPVSMLISALFLTTGGYGVLRVAYPLYPDAAKDLWWLVAIAGVVSIVYGALCAMSQVDFKRLLAYSSISQTGLMLLGASMMNETAFNGAIFMLIAHGTLSAMLFFIAGIVRKRADHQDINRLGGLSSTMPVFTGISTVAIFATLGLPGLCGFIGQVMVLLGSFQAAKGDSILIKAGANPALIGTFAVIALLGSILTAGYMLWTFQRMFCGGRTEECHHAKDVDAQELSVLVPLVIVAILLGVLPALLVFTMTDPTVAAMIDLFE